MALVLQDSQCYLDLLWVLVVPVVQVALRVLLNQVTLGCLCILSHQAFLQIL